MAFLLLAACSFATPACASADAPSRGVARVDGLLAGPPNAACPPGSTLASRLALPMIAPDMPALLLETQAPDTSATTAADTAVTLAGEAPAPRRDESGWPQVLVRPDLLHHASLSFTLATGFTVLFRDHAAAGALALGLGVVKELWDSRHRGADALDLVADVLGVGAALLIVPE